MYEIQCAFDTMKDLKNFIIEIVEAWQQKYDCIADITLNLRYIIKFTSCCAIESENTANRNEQRSERPERETFKIEKYMDECKESVVNVST